MRTLVVLLLIGLMGTVVVGQDQGQWKTKMLQLSQTLSELAPFIYGTAGAKGDKDNLKKNLKTLSNLSHDITSIKPKGDKDPALGRIAKHFEYDLELSEQLIGQGDFGRARLVTKRALNYCISCHTRNSSGVKEFRLPNPPNLKALPWVEQAHFLAATRQFDLALDAFDYALVGKSKPLPVDAWMDSLKKYLAITIRVRKDASVTREALARIRDQGAIPKTLHDDFTKWQMAVKKWQKTPVVAGSAKNSKLAQARELYEEGQKLKTGENRDTSLIHNLRAAVLLNEFIQNQQSGKPYAQSLYYLGRIAEDLGDLNFWDDETFYYEECIHALPHSQISGQCFAGFEAVFNRVYGGSGAREKAPAFALKRLKYLQERSQIKK